ERVFYDNAVTSGIEVEAGQITEVDIDLFSLVNVPDTKSQILIPESYSLSNYPNPFNPKTTIQYELPQKSLISLKIYDVSGRLVKILIEGEKKAGIHTVLWDGKNEYNQDMTSGIYFCRLESTIFSGETKQMVLLR
ncbi:MAG: T9SS C-terminal target domain-containing protein, partial [Gemmatimonadetes bacterium]